MDSEKMMAIADVLKTKKTRPHSEIKVFDKNGNLKHTVPAIKHPASNHIMKRRSKRQPGTR